MGMSFIGQVYAQTASTVSDKTKEGDFFSNTFGLISKIIVVVIIFAVFMLLAKIMVYRIIAAIKKNQKEEEHQEMMVLSSRLIYISFSVIAIAIGLGVTDLFGEMGWLLGAIGLGVGFALQTIIGNYVAGLTLLMQKKVHIGDMIEIDTYRGMITNIGSRAVTVHDVVDGTDILIPNLDFFNKYVRIYTANPYRRVWVEIGVGYDTDFARAYEKIFEILKRYPEVEVEPPPDIICDEVKDSAVNLQVRWWIKSNLKWWAIRSNILQNVFVELQTIGVDISFPIRTLRIDSHESDALFDYIKKDPPRYYDGPGLRAPTHRR